MNDKHDFNEGNGDGDFAKWLRGSIGKFEEEEMKALGLSAQSEASKEGGEKRSQENAPDLTDSIELSANESQKAAGEFSSEGKMPADGEAEGSEEEKEEDGEKSRPEFSYREKDEDEKEDGDDEGKDEDKKGLTYEEIQRLLERARPKPERLEPRHPEEIPELMEMLERDDDDDGFIPCDEIDDDDDDFVPCDEIDDVLFGDEDKLGGDGLHLLFHSARRDGSDDESSGGSLAPDEGSDMEERLRHLREDALNGSPEALYTTAIYMIRGYHMRRSVAEGIALLGIAASLDSEDALDALREFNVDDLVTLDVYHDGIIISAEAPNREIKIEGEAYDALAWADFKVSLEYLMGEKLFKSTGESEKWEDLAKARGCYLIHAYEDLEHKYGNKCDALARALERAEDEAKSEDERKKLRKVCEELDDALFEVNLTAFRLFETPSFMDEYSELDCAHDEACVKLDERIEEAEETLKELGGDDGE